MKNYIFEPVTKKQAISMCNDNRIKHINLTIKNCTKELKDGFSVKFVNKLLTNNNNTKISISLEKNNDALYEIGTNVKITYHDNIMESYPAQIKATKVEIKSADNFEILFKERQKTDSYNKKYAILDKTESDKYDYNIYAYNGSVNIRIDNKEYSLKQVLTENKITMNEIIEKANQDERNGKIKVEMYKDGGSILYKYDNYAIIKCHTLEGNRDVYIGSKDMSINDLKI